MFNYMVYKFLEKIPTLLQRHCLLCSCGIDAKSQVFGLCSYCLASLPSMEPSCQHCGELTAKLMLQCGDCLSAPPCFDRVFCATRFNPDAQLLIHQLKQFDLAAARCLTDCLYQAIAQSELAIDAIVSVPMHWRRAFIKGNNHSALLAKRLAKKLGISCQQQWIKKLKHTKTQRGLSAKQRKKNLSSAFTCLQDVSGLHIAIVDDVITTGSTMNEIAKALKSAGAARVYAIAVAKA